MMPLLTAMDGPQARAKVEAALRGFDVKGPFRLQTLGQYGPSPHPDAWTVTLSDPKGRRYTAYFDRDDRLRAVERADVRPTIPKSPLPPADAARVDRWLAAIHPRFPTRVFPFDYSATGRRYQILVGGYPFVEPRFYYDFGIDRGAFAGFTRSDDVPAVGPATPRLGAADALRLAARACAPLFPPGRVRYDVDPRPPRLAWLDVAGSPPERLVWAVLVRPTILGGNWSKSPSSFELYFDAITGAATQRNWRR